MTLSTEDLALITRSVRDTRAEPESFARGAALLEASSSVAARRQFVRATLRRHIRELRQENLDPSGNPLATAYLRELCDLLPSRLPRFRAFILPPSYALKHLAYCDATLGRHEAEAIVLLAAYHYDDNPDPNPAMPPCFAKPRPEDLTEPERRVFYGVGLMGRRNQLPDLMPRLRWAWERIDSWPAGQHPTSSHAARHADVVNQGHRSIGDDLSAIVSKAEVPATRRRRSNSNRRHRSRTPVRMGWIYKNDAVEKFGVSASNLDFWKLSLAKGEWEKDENTGQIRFERAALEALLRSKSRL